MIRTRTARYIFALLISIFILPGEAEAAELTSFQGTLNPVTTEGYAIKVHGDGHNLELSISDLEKLPLYKTNIKTNWNLNGEFVGVKIIDLLKHAGITKFKRLFVRASNDYKITIERTDKGMDNAILASRLNGKPFSLDNKGPFFVVWPDQAEDVLVGKSVATKWAWSTVEIQKIR